MKLSAGASRMRRMLFVVMSILVTAHQLPAPVIESEEKPTPAAEIAPTAKPSHKKRTKSEASEPSTNPVKQASTVQRSRFAGKWAGTMPEVPWGNVATELIVDQAETTMEWQESGKRKGLAKAQQSGSTLQATFPGWARPIWSLTPEPDGMTAQVRLQAFMNDQKAVFRRVSEPSASKIAR